MSTQAAGDSSRASPAITSGTGDISSTAFWGRTSITAQLWAERRKALVDIPDPTCASTPGAIKHRLKDDKTAAESRVVLSLPLKSDPLLRQQYENFRGGVRFGRILEDMDAVSGNVVFHHTLPRHLSLVTAAVDRLDLQEQIPLDEDLEFRGRLTWCGRSSMECQVALVSVGASSCLSSYLCKATFVFVALDPQTGRSTKVPTLIADDPDDERLFSEGEQNKKRRKHQQEHALEHRPPSEAEIHLIHEFFRHRAQLFQSVQPIQRGCDATTSSAFIEESCLPSPPQTGGASALAGGVDRGDPFVSLKSTQMQSVVVCHPQERNTRGKIFGGYLMRQAYELAFSTASMFFGPLATVHLYAADEIVFHHPVEIGSVLTFTAKVVYTPIDSGDSGSRGGSSRVQPPSLADHACQMKVACLVTHFGQNKQYLSNTFHFTFTSSLNGQGQGAAGTGNGCQGVHVRPESYEEAMEWVDGRRRFLRSKALSEGMPTEELT